MTEQYRHCERSEAIQSNQSRAKRGQINPNEFILKKIDFVLGVPSHSKKIPRRGIFYTAIIIN
jgi:hypothetical protein